MKAIARDMSALLSSSQFGEAAGSVTWRGRPIPRCIFDDEDIEVETPDGPATIMHQAVLTGASADFPGIAANDPVVIRGVTYRVDFWKDDGTGQIEIYLERMT